MHLQEVDWLVFFVKDYSNTIIHSRYKEYTLNYIHVIGKVDIGSIDS